MKKSKSTARKRVELIIQVQSGQITASEAARKLGISRKTYYKWEQRGLEALLGAVTDRSPGRPATPADPEKDAMEQSLSEMERQMRLAEQRAEIRDYFISSEEVRQLDRIQKILTKKKRIPGDTGGSDGEAEDR